MINYLLVHWNIVAEQRAYFVDDRIGCDYYIWHERLLMCYMMMLSWLWELTKILKEFSKLTQGIFLFSCCFLCTSRLNLSVCSLLSQKYGELLIKVEELKVYESFYSMITFQIKIYLLYFDSGYCVRIW